MPTYDRLQRFMDDWNKLSPDEQEAFLAAVRQFVEDLERDGKFRKGLRVKRVQGTKHVFEMTFAGDGRATWEYGDEVHAGQPHVVWRRVGGHGIFGSP